MKKLFVEVKNGGKMTYSVSDLKQIGQDVRDRGI